MIKDVSITIKPENEKNTGLINSLIYQELKKAGIQFQKQDIATVFQKNPLMRGMAI